MPSKKKTPSAEKDAEFLQKAFQLRMFCDRSEEDAAVATSATRAYHANYAKQFAARSSVCLEYTKKLGMDIMVDHRARQESHAVKRMRATAAAAAKERATKEASGAQADQARAAGEEQPEGQPSADLSAEAQALADWEGALAHDDSAAARADETFEQSCGIITIARAANGKLKATGSLHFGMLPQETAELLRGADAIIARANAQMEAAYVRFGELPMLTADSVFVASGLNSLLSTPQSAVCLLRAMLHEILNRVVATRILDLSKLLQSAGAAEVVEQMKGAHASSATLLIKSVWSCCSSAALTLCIHILIIQLMCRGSLQLPWAWGHPVG